MKIRITCEDKYEAQKLASLIYVHGSEETYVRAVLNAFGNELVLSLKDKSAHSVLLSDEKQVEIFMDFIQSVFDNEHRITSTETFDKEVEIVKN